MEVDRGYSCRMGGGGGGDSKHCKFTASQNTLEHIILYRTILINPHIVFHRVWIPIFNLFSKLT